MRYVFALLLLALPLLGTAGSLAQIEIYDRTAGRVLPIHEHHGRLYVAGEPQHQYEVRVHNSQGGRVLAVTSVDGVNVISGATAAETQDGYVIGAYDSVAIEGWRKSLDDVATFYFTRLSDSYAARTGRPDNVGVIGVALFHERFIERRHCCDELNRQGAAGSAPSAPEAAAEPQADAGAAAESDRSARARGESKLGTGHGERESSPAQYVDFRRAASRPDEVISIFYDSRRNLVAQGVIPRQRWLAERVPDPDPFPNGFVPDPLTRSLRAPPSP
jgi:hypothetical protein